MSTGGVRREAAREPELNRKPNSADTKFFDNAIAVPYEVYGFCLRECGEIDEWEQRGLGCLVVWGELKNPKI